MTIENWSVVKGELRSRIGQDSYRNWIEPLQFRGIDQQAVTFQAPSKFLAHWVRQHYSKDICGLFWNRGEKVVRIEFELSDDGNRTGSEESCVTLSKPIFGIAQSEGKAAITSEGLEAFSNPLDPRFKFESFVTGRSNELAYAAAWRVATEERMSFNPLFLYSGVGLGKTHLMQAIAWEILTQHPEKRVLYLTAQNFMYRFVEAIRSKSMHEFKDMLRAVDVLLVDDVQFIAGKDSTQDEFFFAFNTLVEQNKQVVISADRSPSDLEKVEERIRSRLQWGLMVDIHATDYELRLGILQSKAEQQLANSPNLVIEDGVLEFLAQRISSNVRVLEGALTRLVAFADLTSAPVSMEMTHDALADLLRASKQKVTLDHIIKKTAEFYNIRISDITGSRRTRNIAQPRQIGMYLAKSLTTKSLPDIGRAFGGRDHTTVIHAVRKVEDLIRHDGQIAEDVEALRRRIEA